MGEGGGENEMGWKKKGTNKNTNFPLKLKKKCLFQFFRFNSPSIV